MSIFRKITSLYIYSNIHVSLAISALILLSYLLSGDVFNINYLVFSYVSTITLYTFHRLIGCKKNKEYAYFPRINIYIKNKKTFVVWGIIHALLAFYFYISLENSIKLNLIFPFILSILYILPLRKNKRVRDLPFFKIFMISMSWSIIGAYIPLNALDFPLRIFWTIIFFLFVLANTIPFDIRDFEIDKKMGTKTIPTRFGILNSIKFAQYILLIISVILLLLNYEYQFNNLPITSLIVTCMIAIPIIGKSSPSNAEFYISGWIEGLPMLPILLYFLLDHLLPMTQT